MTKHTPTPWFAEAPDKLQIRTLQPTLNDVAAVASSRANAAFIVRAVNAHDDLVAALEVVRRSAGWGAMADETHELINAALAKAKAV